MLVHNLRLWRPPMRPGPREAAPTIDPIKEIGRHLVKLEEDLVAAQVKQIHHVGTASDRIFIDTPAASIRPLIFRRGSPVSLITLHVLSSLIDNVPVLGVYGSSLSSANFNVQPTPRMVRSRNMTC